MNTRIEELMIQSGLACDGVDSFDKEALNLFVKNLFKDISEQIDKTPNHHCYTTWDVGMSESTKFAIQKHLKAVYNESV